MEKIKEEEKKIIKAHKDIAAIKEAEETKKIVEETKSSVDSTKTEEKVPKISNTTDKKKKWLDGKKGGTNPKFDHIQDKKIP